MIICPEDQKLILQTVAGLPPDHYFRYCNTEDRRHHWADCKLGYLRLYATLKAYFSGKNAFIDSNPKDLQPAFDLWWRYYIALYELLFKGWNAITALATKEDLSIPDTPGEMLIWLLIDDADAIFTVFFPEVVTGNYYYEFSPQAEYRFRNEGIRVARYLSSEQLNHSQMQQVERYRNQLNKRRKEILWFKVRRLFCLYACEQSAKTNPCIRQELKEFRKAEAEWESDLYAAMHPSKSARGFAIHKGKKLFPASGGQYKKP